MQRPNEYNDWSYEKQIWWETTRQTEELSTIASRMGILIIFLIVIPLLLGFCTVMGGI